MQRVERHLIEVDEHVEELLDVAHQLSRDTDTGVWSAFTAHSSPVCELWVGRGLMAPSTDPAKVSYGVERRLMAPSTDRFGWAELYLVEVDEHVEELFNVAHQLLRRAPCQVFRDLARPHQHLIGLKI